MRTTSSDFRRRAHCHTVSLAAFIVMAFLPVFSSLAQSAPMALAGNSAGLYAIQENDIRRLWDDGSVTSLVPDSSGWYAVTSKGIFHTDGFEKPELRSGGLPSKVLLRRFNGDFVKEEVPETISAFAVDPQDERRLAAATAQAVYYSPDSGSSWISLGSPSTLPGFKAVSFGPPLGTGTSGAGKPESSALWVAHSIRGVHAISTDSSKKQSWVDMSAGLPKVFGQNVEEVASFAWDIRYAKGGFYAGMSFLGAVYQWSAAKGNGSKAAFSPLYREKEDFGWAESLALRDDGSLVFHTREGFRTIGGVEPALEEDTARIRELLSGDLSCIGFGSGSGAFAVNELWRLSPSFSAVDSASPAALARASAAGRNGIYLQTGFVATKTGRDSFFSLMQARGLDTLVIDLKDDYGKLRFKPESPLLATEGKVGDAIDIEAFIADAKKRGIYLIARIVVFKDEALASWNSGALAVRDAKTSGLWRGLRSDGQPYGEQWVDPYSPRVWEYNVEIAREVAARGFDEIQFDYIRFPTDGTNLADARFPAKLPGMSPESALESFLAYARQELSVPISVDIYGANGWYRSGVRTGQDVEMLSRYVDVISPMFYPSHFEQAFLAQEPAILRPYRIYRLGTLRTQAIARGKALVRPYVQAFYLDVSYDRQYYGPSYVLDEVRGVRDGADEGMIFWNNSGRYSDLPAN